ncbi:MAG: radical SAM family heme chaperone HemW [Flavobacteriales bacterium]|nr:radical SAM family heme chaperone HemW [Flavobacteriales bacterium]MCW8913102.1 radical SAM family heme chaperone HemW [Flavobacteriales bacterium]MCW8937816.1 radical SAM family heme chaperone HemW [Flavobacteriales bacterium]MCW8939807.1 radical SAM family heme chaperone HemW [Flavobacteriales bacterium]MCW8967627.1 radical SAM family heme chaperone HemW [Flavobacteriales bacterium]
MSGIYIHIPFCRKKCSYCDFHFSTSLKHKTELLAALQKEIVLKQKLFKKESVNTIYFGGGTPSILNELELNQLVEIIHNNYNVDENMEFTIECNPDDITSKKLNEYKKSGVNRLSIGIQSFFDDDLQFFNRAHNANEAAQSILKTQDAGIENITIDLIYNSPLLTLKKWEQNLDKFISLNVPHLSAYTLTVEPKTALHHLVKTKQTSLPTDEQAIEQFKLLMEKTKQAGLIHYEVSNFGKEGYFSQHNSNYWKGQNYLGIGPSAHSFMNNNSSQKRSWNVANNTKYIKAINQNTPYFEEELIDETTAFNEYILTRLRTIWGLDLEYIKNTFNPVLLNHFEKELEAYKNSKLITISKNTVTLTTKGIFVVDKITADLFYV